MDLISPAISGFSNELSSLVFTDVDFRGCGPLDSIAECDNLRRLWFENVDNLSEEMVDPIVYKEWTGLKDVVASGGVCGRILEWIDDRKTIGENVGCGEFGHGEGNLRSTNEIGLGKKKRKRKRKNKRKKNSNAIGGYVESGSGNVIGVGIEVM